MRHTRTMVLGVAGALAVLTTACAGTQGSLGAPEADVRVTASSTPFAHVTAGPVSGSVPDGWDAVPAASDGDGGVRGGFLASPGPRGMRRMDGSATGLAVTWVDATRVGVPSDYYYLAARGSLMARLTGSDRCRSTGHEVLLDDSQRAGRGGLTSGDYVARAWGRCRAGTKATRWAFFVAAPGFGPVRRMGIPASGLYVVTAAVADDRNARAQLDRMVRRTRFGDASVIDLLGAARRAARMTV